jgi:hypothetical protein
MAVSVKGKRVSLPFKLPFRESALNLDDIASPRID